MYQNAIKASFDNQNSATDLVVDENAGSNSLDEKQQREFTCIFEVHASYAS